MLEQGPTEETIIEQCIRLNQPYPKPIAEAPELGPGLDLFYEAFCALDSCRVMDGPIPWTAIEQYSNYVGIDEEEQRSMMHHYIRHLDSIVTDHRKERNAPTSGKA